MFGLWSECGNVTSIWFGEVQNRIGICEGIKHDIDCVQSGFCSSIFVIPAFQNRGIAQKVIQKVFKLYPETITWRLDTIKEEAGNCHLYEKCGFVRVGVEHVVNEQMTLIDYERCTRRR